MAEPRIPQDRIDDKSASLDDLDHRRLARVGRSLMRARALRRWWEDKSKPWIHQYDGDELETIIGAKTHPDCFHLTRELPRWDETEANEANYGFFDEAPIDGENRPVMGLVQQTFFDQPKRAFLREARDSEVALGLWCKGMQTFVMRYLIRLTGFYETAPYVEPYRRAIEPWLRPISWRPSDQERRSGFGFSQYYYKLRGQRPEEERVGKFHHVDRTRIDLGQLRKKYEWVVVGIRIHDLNLRHPAMPFFNLSIDDEVFAVLSHDFLVEESDPEQDVRGRYGFGYAVLEDPAEGNSTVAWQRPTFGFQSNQFVVEQSGRILGRVTMVTDKLPQLMAFNPWELGRALADRASLGLYYPAMNLGRSVVEGTMPGLVSSMMRPLGRLLGEPGYGSRFDPLSTFVDAVNAVGFGIPASQLSISGDVVLRSVLSDFVRSQLSTIIAARGVWRSVADWTDEKALPDWVKA